MNTFLTSRGYAGPPLEILIGEESLSTRGKVVISKEKLNGLSFLEDLGHELGHLVSYDDGKEDTAKIVEGKLGTLEETDTQGKYNDYLESLKEEYKNLKTEEETKEWLANIPNNEKEYKFNQAIRSLALAWSQNPGGHQFGIMIPDDQNEFFENGTLKQKYKDMGYPEPEKIGDSYGWTLAGHSYKTKVQENGKEKNKNYLVVKFNETEDINSAKDLILNEANNTYKEKLNPNDLVISGKTDTEMIKQVFNSALNYQKNTENTPVNYKILGPNCNTWFFNLSESNNIQNNISDFGGGFADPGAKKELDQNLWKENGGKSGR